MEFPSGDWTNDHQRSGSAPAPTIPGPFFDTDPDAYPQDEGWVTGHALTTIIGLKLVASISGPNCPRCHRWMFTYADLQFCSHGCPENMIEVRYSD